jgi:hypothetical protein
MKALLPLLLLASIAACKSGKKETTGTENTKDTSTTQQVADTAAKPPVPTGKIDIETFGDIKIGQPAAETLKTLGEPGSKSKAEEWAADGLLHEYWKWKDKGLELNMSSEKNNVSGTLAIFNINAEAPCTFKTRAGIGIGSTLDEIKAAYQRDISEADSNNEQVLVGSVYGGIIFTLTKGKVSHIFLGAAAE